jgi:hypothetical protein
MTGVRHHQPPAIRKIASGPEPGLGYKKPIDQPERDRQRWIRRQGRAARGSWAASEGLTRARSTCIATSSKLLGEPQKQG